MKVKPEKYKQNDSKQVSKDNDLEINRSMYYLGKALYQFSLMQANKKHKTMKRGI